MAALFGENRNTSSNGPSDHFDEITPPENFRRGICDEVEGVIDLERVHFLIDIAGAKLLFVVSVAAAPA